MLFKLDPDNKTVPVNLHKHDSGLYRVTYRPSVVGVHMVTIMHRNQPITKHPWKVQVIDTELVIVSGLNETICNKPTSFKGKIILHNTRNKNRFIINSLLFLYYS